MGAARSDEKLAEKCMELIDAVPDTRHLIHGDFHTSNVFLQNTEALLIDMDRLAMGDPIFELGDLYLYYAIHEKDDPDSLDMRQNAPQVVMNMGLLCSVKAEVAALNTHIQLLSQFLGHMDPESN